MLNKFTAAFASIAVATLVGCTTPRPPSPHRLFADTQTPPRESPTTHLKASIYIDATRSMYGFVNMGSGTITPYSNLLQGVMDVLESSWQECEADFFRTGSNVERVRSTSARPLDLALVPEFYMSADLSLITRLDLPITKAEKQRLTIVISDLQQQSQALSEVVAAVRNTSFSHGHAAGVIAIRSDFNGDVCDVLPPPSTRCFSYKSPAKDIKKGRPVYLLALGYQRDVTLFLMTLSSILKQRGVTQLESVLIPRTVGQIRLFQPREQQFASLIPDSRALPVEDSDMARGFTLHSSEAPVSIGTSAVYEFDRVPLIPELAVHRAVTTARFRRGRGTAHPWEQPRELPVDAAALAAIDEDFIRWSTSSTLLADPPGDWRAIEFRVTLPAGLAPEGAFVRPPWVDAWDLPLQELPTVLANNEEPYYWNRTLRLREFVDGLFHAASQTTPEIEIGRIYYYVRID
jgi:hypothetical protein